MIRCFQIAAAVLLLAFGASCNSARTSKALHENTVLDRVLMSQEVILRIRSIEQDLPGDVWQVGPSSRPGRHNTSRATREVRCADELLREIQPRLKDISARDLFNSIVLEKRVFSSPISGVAYYVYMLGNDMIIRELAGRPPPELNVLRRHQDDYRETFTGDNGPSRTLRDIVRFTLFHEALSSDSPTRR
jgi:hypothetical protein